MFFSRKQKIGGVIKYYELEDWWMNGFTENERLYIRLKFHPMGHEDEVIDEGNILSSSMTVTTFLSSLETWFKSKEDKAIQEKIHEKLLELSKEQVSKLEKITYNPESNNGFMGYYKLEDWWMNTFSVNQRKIYNV